MSSEIRTFFSSSRRRRGKKTEKISLLKISIEGGKKTPKIYFRFLLKALFCPSFERERESGPHVFMLLNGTQTISIEFETRNNGRFSALAMKNSLEKEDEILQSS
jgi:hypothetical protein